MKHVKEVDKHHLVFDRPYVYTCPCGFVMYWYPDGSQKVVEKPKGKIEYLSCGHAICARRMFNNVEQCILCLSGHELK